MFILWVWDFLLIGIIPFLSLKFPPVLIHVGTDEILLSDSTRLAEKARAAGVDVQIKIWQGMCHIFPFFAPFVPEAAQAIAEIGDAIRRQIG